ncbi:MAG: MFS transporter, partial [Spirochaetes bacterium]|nr:MFS transporter [Spirochaetota bacterium]
AGFLFKNHIQWIFWGDALTAFVAFILILWFVPETKPDEKAILEKAANPASGEKGETGNTLVVFFRRPFLVTFSLFIAICGFIYNQHGYTLSLQLNDLFLGDGAKIYGYIMSCNAITVLLLTTLLTYLTRKNTPIINVSIAVVFYAIGFGALYFVQSIFFFLITTIIWTVGEILVFINYQVYVAEHTPITHRTRFNGVLQMIMGISMLASPLLSGYLSKWFGLNNIWIIVFFLALLVSLGLIIQYQIEKKTGSIKKAVPVKN